MALCYAGLKFPSSLFSPLYPNRKSFWNIPIKTLARRFLARVYSRFAKVLMPPVRASSDSIRQHRQHPEPALLHIADRILNRTVHDCLSIWVFCHTLLTFSVCVLQISWIILVVTRVGNGHNPLFCFKPSTLFRVLAISISLFSFHPIKCSVTKPPSTAPDGYVQRSRSVLPTLRIDRCKAHFSFCSEFFTASIRSNTFTFERLPALEA